MSARDKTCDIEKLDGNRAPAIDTGAVIRFAAVGEVVARTSAFDLEIADRPLGVDGCEAAETNAQSGALQTACRRSCSLREVAYAPDQRRFFMIVVVD